MVTTDTTKRLFSTKPRSLKNLEPMTSLDFTILAFFANCLRIDFESTFLGWYSIGIAMMISTNWLSFRKSLNKLLGGMFGFIRSRGSQRPTQKPPYKTTTKKSNQAFNFKLSLFMIAIVSIAFFSTVSLWDEDPGSGNIRFAFSGDSKTELEARHSLFDLKRFISISSMIIASNCHDGGTLLQLKSISNEVKELNQFPAITKRNNQSYSHSAHHNNHQLLPSFVIIGSTTRYCKVVPSKAETEAVVASQLIVACSKVPHFCCVTT